MQNLDQMPLPIHSWPGAYHIAAHSRLIQIHVILMTS